MKSIERPISVPLTPRQAEKVRRGAERVNLAPDAVAAAFVHRSIQTDGTYAYLMAPRVAESPPEGAILTSAEAAALLQVDDEDVRDLAAAGELPGVQIGGHWRFAWSAIQQWASKGGRP